MVKLPSKMLVFFIFISELIGVVAGFFTVSSIPTWYMGLIKPFFSPPNWIFGPVWTTLYALMAIAAYLVWKKRKGNPIVKRALWVYWIQLILNFLWSFVFFGLRDISLGFIDIILMVILIVYTTLIFSKISKAAGWLFIPYLFWVSFATVLNFSLLMLN